jgi:Zn-dependent metalloprotease
MAPIYVRDSEFAIVQKLFQKNNLSLFDFQIWLYQSDTIGNHYVFCNQFYHGIQIMAYRVIFWFNNQDIYDNLVGELVGNITIDTIPSVTTNNAGILFRQAIASDSFNKNNLSSFRSYGFNAELELYDLNYGKEFVPKKFILVWIITVANGAKYPVGCIRADSLHLIYYDNGREYNR